MYAHHRSELTTVVDGVTQKDLWEHRARGRGEGAQLARKMLEEPPFPEALEYLWHWAGELVGRSGASDRGPNRLTYTTVRHWAEITGSRPTPLEVRGLMRLDSALLGLTKPEEEEEPAEKPRRSWPTKEN